MAGFDDDVDRAHAVLEYRRLQRLKREIERDLQRWMERGTALAQLVGPSHRQQLVALRSEMVSSLRSILGV